MASMARLGDLAVIISSGGTTGVPKGSWRSFAAYTALVNAPSPPGRRQLVNGPLAYLSQVLADMTLLGGGSVVLDEGYDAARTLAMVESERITDLFLVEAQMFETMDHPDMAWRDLSSLRTATHIGDPAPSTLRRRARERFGPVIAHTYAASELGVVSALSPAEHDLACPETFACDGKVRPGVEVRFRLEDGTLAGPEKPGTIEARSPAMAGGYRNRPDSEAFQDGWYRSGDLGFLDADGYLHVLGRADDIAWSEGAMASPLLIQDTLCRLPGVRYAAVVRDQEADAWVAAVVAWPGSPIDPAQCRGAIATEHGPASVTVLPMDRAAHGTGQARPVSAHPARARGRRPAIVAGTGFIRRKPRRCGTCRQLRHPCFASP